MEIEFRLDQIDDVARQVLPQLKNSIIRLEGVMGAGKTTLIKLLLRLYDYSSGRITIDGTAIDQYQIAVRTTDDTPEVRVDISSIGIQR